MKKILLLLPFLIFCKFVFSQNTTSRLRIESGGSIYFYFNSLDQYKNGITYNNWTKVSVYFVDTTAAGATSAALWILKVKANSNQINSDEGDITHFLPLNTIELEATYTSSTGGTATPAAMPFALSDTDQPLFTDGSQTKSPLKPTIVNITYHCGKSITVPNNLLVPTTRFPDYYYVDIILTLEPQP
jgi:hypothetical protein